MGSFWGGFAGTMKDQIGQARTAGLEEEAKQKEQDRRQKFLSEERALDRAERIDDRNWQLNVADSKDMSLISEVPGPAGTPVYMQSVRSTGPGGKIQITSEQVTDSATKARYQEYKAAKAAEAQKTENALKKDSLDIAGKQFEVDNQDRVLNAELAARNRQGRGSGGTKDDVIPTGDMEVLGRAEDELKVRTSAISDIIERKKNSFLAPELETLQSESQDLYTAFVKDTITYSEYNRGLNLLVQEFKKKHKIDLEPTIKAHRDSKNKKGKAVKPAEKSMLPGVPTDG